MPCQGESWSLDREFSSWLGKWPQDKGDALAEFSPSGGGFTIVWARQLDMGRPPAHEYRVSLPGIPLREAAQPSFDESARKLLTAPLVSRTTSLRLSRKAALHVSVQRRAGWAFHRSVADRAPRVCQPLGPNQAGDPQPGPTGKVSPP